MNHLVRFQIQLGAGIFKHLEVCIFLAFLHRQKKISDSWVWNYGPCHVKGNEAKGDEGWQREEGDQKILFLGWWHLWTVPNQNCWFVHLTTYEIAYCPLVVVNSIVPPCPCPYSGVVQSVQNWVRNSLYSPKQWMHKTCSFSTWDSKSGCTNAHLAH